MDGLLSSEDKYTELMNKIIDNLDRIGLELAIF